MSALSRSLSSVEPVAMPVLDNRFLMDSAVSANVDVTSDLCLVGYPYIEKEKLLYKHRHLDSRREAAWGLAKDCRGFFSPLARHSPFIANGGFCCFFSTISLFIAYCRLISNNGASCGVGLEVGHG